VQGKVRYTRSKEDAEEEMGNGTDQMGIVYFGGTL
jgi:hypothetical protein